MNTRTLLLALLLLPAFTAAAQKPLSIGDAIADSLGPDSKHTYTVQVDADRFVYGYVDQISVDAVVQVRDSDGDVLNSFDNPRRGPESFFFVTSKPDTYTIEVSPFQKAQGRYEILLVTNELKARNPQALTDQLLRRYAGDTEPGVVVSVVKKGEVAFAKGYGMANLTYDVPMSANTGMSVASVSKQFTGMAILLLQNEGKLSLDDDVRKHIPELKDFGTPVTLRHMLNHTSGYREILNFLPLAGWAETDAMTRETPIQVIQRQPALQNPPGAEYNYNNTTFMLLATVVERVSGQDFKSFMESRIFSPLGMNNTTIRMHQGQVIPNSSRGYVYAEEGGFRSVTDFASAYGASGVNSTALDMTKWMLNYRDASVGGAAAIDLLATPAVLTTGDTTGYGLGLSVGEWRGQRRFAHSGGEVSHRSYFAWFPDIESGIFVSSNHPAFSTSVWSDIADAFFGDLLEPKDDDDGDDDAVAMADSAVAASTQHAAPTSAQLEAIAGTYSFVGAPLLIKYTVEDGKLFAQATNQPRFAVTATSDSTFDFVGVQASVTFHYEDDGSVKRGTHHQGPDSPMEKVVDVVTAAELEAYAGRYYNEELQTIYTLGVVDGKLLADHRDYEPFELSHIRDDEFKGAEWFMSQVKFDRDPTGAVSGFSASNGRTRGVWFVRMAW